MPLQLPSRQIALTFICKKAAPFTPGNVAKIFACEGSITKNKRELDPDGTAASNAARSVSTSPELGSGLLLRSA